MFEILLILAFLAGLSACIVLLKMASKQLKSGAGLWGMHLRRLSCPKCHHSTPLVRKPRSARQALWGGWTCSECGTEMDKWGTDISASVQAVDAEFIGQLEPQGKERSPLEQVFDDNDSRK